MSSTEPPAPSFQTKTALRRMLDEVGLSPRKRLGQHFLIDRNLMKKLIEAAEPGHSDCVLEVGAGMGSLTAMLAPLVGRVVAVEIDPELARLAGVYLSGQDNVTLLRADALQNKSTIAPDLVSAITQAHAEAGGPLKLVANLPYDIATPLVINLLTGDLPLARLCFTVQAEVGDRFLAEPDTSDYGPVAIITQVLAAGRRICKVPPQAFWPVPKVDSVMLRLDVRPSAERPFEDPADFTRLVRAFFQHRRKTIAHSGKRIDPTGRLSATISQVGLAGEARPEQLTVRQWVDLYLAWMIRIGQGEGHNPV